jgi:hypothetical protein
VDEDEKGPYILHSKVEKISKQKKDKKATCNDNVAGDVLKLLGEDGFKIMKHLINSVYETEEWPKD